MLPLLEILFGGLSRWSYKDDRPSTLDASDAIDYPFSGSDEVGLNWFLPVNPTYNYIQAWKNERFGKCVIKEQEVED